MGIRFLCQYCQKKIHVKAYLAGKKAQCPHCQGKIRIPDPASDGQETRLGGIDSDSRDSGLTPQQKSSQPHPQLFAASPEDPNSFTLDRPEELENRAGGQEFTDWIADDPNASWYLRSPEGKQFGPTSGPEMRVWLGEGRVSEGCFVWREGWANWRRSTDVFPGYFQEQELKHQPVFVNQDQEPSTEDLSHQENQKKNKTKPNEKKKPPGRSRANNSFWLYVGILLMVAVFSGVAFLAFTQHLQSSPGSSPQKTQTEEKKTEQPVVVDPFSSDSE